MEKKYNLHLDIPISTERDDKSGMLADIQDLLENNPFQVNVWENLCGFNNCIAHGISLGRVVMNLEEDTTTSRYQLKARYVGTNPYTHHNFYTTITKEFQSLHDLNDWIENNRKLEYIIGFNETTDVKIESWEVYSIQKNRLC